MSTTSLARPASVLISQISQMSSCGRSVIVVTGDVEGLYPNTTTGGYDRLEPVLADALRAQYHILFFDINGVDFYADEDIEAFAHVSTSLSQPVSQPKSIFSFLGSGAPTEPTLDASHEVSIKEVTEKIAATDYSPLACLELIRKFADSLKDGKAKPLCVIIRDASIVFPSGDPGKLSDPQLQRLQSLLNWVRDPQFVENGHLVILVNNTRSDLQKKIFELSNMGTVESPLPLEHERLDFIRYCVDKLSLPELLKLSPEELAHATASLTLANIQTLFKTAQVTGSTVDQTSVSKALDKHLEELFGRSSEGVPIAQIDHGGHIMADVDYYGAEKGILEKTLKRSKNPETAVSVIGVFGPNGGGKTYITEGVLRSSGWRILRLKGLRSSDFGGTERLFETLMLVLEPFDLVALVFDEADTDLGDVRNNPQSHEVERRLYGKFISVMSDKRYLGKLIWVLMTARPDKLGSDVRSRCLVKVPIFDLAGEERKQYVRRQLERRSLVLPDEEFNVLFSKTLNYSNRDLDGMLTLYFAERQDRPALTIQEFMEEWQADDAIADDRKFQMLLAAQNCTYPALLPEWIKSMTPKQRAEEIELLKFQLGIQ